MKFKRPRKKCRLCGSTWGVAIDGLCVNHRREKVERTTGKPYGSFMMFFYNPDGSPINPNNKYLLRIKEEAQK